MTCWRFAIFFFHSPRISSLSVSLRWSSEEPPWLRTSLEEPLSPPIRRPNVGSVGLRCYDLRTNKVSTMYVLRMQDAMHNDKTEKRSNIAGLVERIFVGKIEVEESVMLFNNVEVLQSLC